MKKTRKEGFPEISVKLIYKLEKLRHSRELLLGAINKALGLLGLPNDQSLNHKATELLWELQLVEKGFGRLTQAIFVRYVRAIYEYGFIPISCRPQSKI